MNKPYPGYVGAFAICLAAALWGLDGVVLTPRLYPLDIQVVVLVFHALPFLIMNLFLYKEYGKLRDISLSNWVYLFLVSLFGGALGTLFIVKALFLVNFKALTIVVLLQKLQPVFVIVLAWLLLKEKLKRGFLLWAGIALTAGYFLTFGLNMPTYDPGDKTALAALYSLMAALSFGSSTVFSKKILGTLDFRSGTFFRYGITSLIMLAIVIASGKLGVVATIDRTQWMIFGIIGLTTGSGAIFLYYFGLVRVRAMLATICELCFPISAILLDYFINHRMLTPVQWLSAAIMIAAILKLSLQKEN